MTTSKRHFVEVLFSPEDCFGEFTSLVIIAHGEFDFYESFHLIKKIERILLFISFLIINFLFGRFKLLIAALPNISINARSVGR